jgi:hypothetical protein
VTLATSHLRRRAPHARSRRGSRRAGAAAACCRRSAAGGAEPLPSLLLCRGSLAQCLVLRAASRCTLAARKGGKQRGWRRAPRRFCRCGRQRCLRRHGAAPLKLCGSLRCRASAAASASRSARLRADVAAPERCVLSQRQRTDCRETQRHLNRSARQPKARRHRAPNVAWEQGGWLSRLATCQTPTCPLLHP